MLVGYAVNRTAWVIVGVALLLASLAACFGGGDSAVDGRVMELEAKVEALERAAEDLAGENAGLREDIAALERERADLAAALEAAQADIRQERAALTQALEASAQQNELLDARVRALEEIVAKAGPLLSGLDQWAKGEDDSKTPDGGGVVERTAALAGAFGGVVRYVEHAGRGDRTVLVAPPTVVLGETPLIVSLHGFGGDSALQSAYLPLHERAAADGFGLLLPNGVRDGDGNRFWNPTDACCAGGKSGEDDVAYLRELVAEAREAGGFGPVYVVGYSNGGFMAHHLACKGLDGLRAVASLAGTSYVADASCAGAAPVSVLHVHGTADDVIRFGGDVSVRVTAEDGSAGFYLGAREMAARWGRLAGCAWPEDGAPYAAMDFDRRVAGAETRAYRVDSGCAGGVTIELWVGEGTGHLPGYGAGFLDGVLGWLLG